ncbi:MAG: OmpA family protein [Aquaspirillum sp.]|jgi:OOP family OmpA-OmpF porin|nr:OmpA family protein [Aquaspirillum sp.]
MKTSNKLKLTSLAGAMLVALLSAQAHAVKPGYLADQGTDSVVRNSYNECWRTSAFDKATNGLVECGDAEKKAAPVKKLVKEKVSLSAEVLFDFNKSTLRADGRKAVDPVIAKIKSNGADLQAVEVVGHTDYLGSDSYNKALSERRANAVKNYLVAGGIPADRVTSVGNGESEAKMTKECQAKFKKRADLIACLAPDRRVDVEISAMREEAAK